MTARPPALDLAAGVRRLAEALDAHFASTRTWRVTAGALDTSIALAGARGDRVVAHARVAGDHLEVATPGTCAGNRCWPLDDASLPAIVAAIAALPPLTLWDLAPGRRFRVTAAFRGLPPGTDLQLVAIHEVKPSGNDLYQFQHAAGMIELWCDRPEDATILASLAAYLTALD